MPFTEWYWCLHNRYEYAKSSFEFSVMSELDTHSPVLDVAQGGFRPQHGPLDQALCLHDLMHDFAYDTVDCGAICSALAGLSLSRAVLGLLINLFDDVPVVYSVLSPHLYSLYINYLASPLRSAATVITFPDGNGPIAINSLLFADDALTLYKFGWCQPTLPVSANLVKVFSNYWQDQVDSQLAAATVVGRFILLRAYHPDATRPDPILYFVLQEHILDL
ncbi:hypothetical protein G6F42_019027 [Rhizopus arrhizus]|nr:hypothetical protein G6F42_019027 [Rhizopus arrhizus]